MCDRDRVEFLELLGEAAQLYRWRVHTFTLMTNHFHLLIQTMEPTLSRGMQKLEGDFVSGFNKRLGRVGPLFQGRFRAHLVDSEHYLLTLARYIVLNPVRAGMVASPGDWAWSSYRALAGLCSAPPWLWMRTILEQFHPTDLESASRRYREFVAEGAGLATSPWENLVAQLYLGGPEFIARVDELVRNRDWKPSDSRRQQDIRACGIEQVRQAVETQFRVDLTPKSWRNQNARYAFALLAREESISTLTQIAAVLKMSSPGVHHLLERAGKHAQDDSRFRLELNVIRDTLRSGSNPF